MPSTSIEITAEAAIRMAVSSKACKKSREVAFFVFLALFRRTTLFRGGARFTTFFPVPAI
jgi:hypothetical protein